MRNQFLVHFVLISSKMELERSKISKLYPEYHKLNKVTKISGYDSLK